MNDQQLGRLERVDIRDQWKNEQGDFTPWLAKPENLEILGETLGLELELEAKEKKVGEFQADIVCKVVGMDSLVLIENQLEQTDHKHLGQLLTYAAGLHAVTIVWLAAPFRNEHRAALDWLNNITDEEFRFFGLEVELWRIGDSAPAPKFDIVSQPNDWSRSVARAAKDELSEGALKQKEYWTEFQKQLNSFGGPISGNRKPQPASWMSYGIRRTGFSLNPAMNSQKNWIRAELYIDGSDASKRFDLLKQLKEEIEQELGNPLEWEELPDKRACRIAQYLRNVDPLDERDWPRQHKWLVEHLNKMHDVFSQRVKKL